MNRLLVAAILAAGLLVGCSDPAPTEAPTDIPADHTVRRGSAWHKAGLNTPLDATNGCSSSSCHQADLRGGEVTVDGVAVTVPSCYQCHGVKW